MSLFRRLKDLTLSNVYALIDKAEDPIKMTDQYLRNMQEDLQDVEKAVAAQVAQEKKFKQLYEEQKDLVTKRDEQAHRAAQVKNVELARRALEEKKAATEKMNDYKSSYDQHKKVADQLRGKWEDMKQQYSALKSKRETLVARAQTARSQRDLHQSMAGWNSESTAVDGFQRMTDKVRQLEAEAEASQELFRKEKSLDEEFAEVDKDTAIEEELAVLMKKYEE